LNGGNVVQPNSPAILFRILESGRTDVHGYKLMRQIITGHGVHGAPATEVKRPLALPAIFDARLLVFYRLIDTGKNGKSYTLKLVPVISGGVFHLFDPVLERHSFHDLGAVALSIQLPPFSPGAQNQFEGHGERGLSAEATPGLHGSVAHRRESALDRVGGADIHPVLGPEIVETQQAFTVLDQTFDGLVVLHALGFDEEIKSALGFRLGLGHPDIVQLIIGFALPGPSLQNIRERVIGK
jgi:hypothetical protein